MTNDAQMAPGVGERLLEGVDEFSEAVVDRLRADIPAYANVPLEEHRALMRTQLAQILGGLVAGRGPSAPELAAARELGWRRAAQGVPLPDVIEAYHSCYRELWQALVTEAGDDDEHMRDLVASAAVLWSWTHRLSASVASGHAEALQTRFAENAELRRRLFHAFAEGRAADPKTAQLAAGLGLEADGEFEAVCAADTGERTPDELQQALDRRVGTAVCGSSGRIVVVLAQGMATASVLDELRSEGDGVGVGVGIRRAGLAGAAASIADGVSALALAARRGAVVRFEDEWMDCVVFQYRDALREPLARGREIAAEHPHLAETVRAFADSGFRVTDCARRMHLHPNSAKYRLDRWRELSGWDVQTFDGLVRSLTSIEILATDEPSRPDRG